MRGDERGGRSGRRAWLAGVLASGLGGGFRAASAVEAGPLTADERAEVEAVCGLGKAAGLRPFGVTVGPRYVGVGDAPEAFRALTVRDCRAVADDFLDGYAALGFAVRPPAGRLTVVVLADDRSFAAYAGDPSFRVRPTLGDPRPTRSGYYERRTGRLVVYDRRAALPDAPASENLTLLAHEATHQLCWGAGLFDPRGDVPLCVAEGLAMCGEARKLRGRTPPGGPNPGRLRDIARQLRRKVPWIPAADLFDDRAFADRADPQRTVLAYAESWLLVDLLLNDRARLRGFRGYLGAIRPRRDPGSRRDDARDHLGDLDRLDQDLRRESLRRLREA